MGLHKIAWPMKLDNPNWKPASVNMRRWLKKQMRKAVRRDGKLNQDDALKTKRYKGWES